MSVEFADNSVPIVPGRAMPAVGELETALPVAPPVSEEEYVRSSYTGFQRGIAAFTTVIAGAAGGLVSSMVDARPLGDARMHSFAELYPADPLPKDAKTAPSPEDDAYGWVDAWLRAPANPRLVNFYEEANRIYEQGGRQGDLLDIQNRLKFEIRQETAARFGLTVFDATDALSAFRADLDDKPGRPLTFSQALAIANGYLSNFGVEVVFGDNISYDYNLQPATLDNMDHEEAKRHLRDIVNAFSRMPLEYVQGSGITRLIFATQTPDTNVQIAAYIHPDLNGPEGAAYVYNVSSISGLGTTFHEFWHRWDFLLSGGYAMDTDPYFENLNWGAPYGNGLEDVGKGVVVARDYGYYTVGDFWAAFGTTQDRFKSHIGEPDCLDAAVTASNQMVNIGNMTVFISNYAGQSNVVEQKAETGQNIGIGHFGDMLNPWTPAIRNQFMAELVRLANYRPDLAAFFVAMSDHYAASQASTLDYFQNACTPGQKGGDFSGTNTK